MCCGSCWPADKTCGTGALRFYRGGKVFFKKYANPVNRLRVARVETVHACACVPLAGMCVAPANRARRGSAGAAYRITHPQEEIVMKKSLVLATVIAAAALAACGKKEEAPAAPAAPAVEAPAPAAPAADAAAPAAPAADAAAPAADAAADAAKQAADAAADAAKQAAEPAAK